MTIANPDVVFAIGRTATREERRLADAIYGQQTPGDRFCRRCGGHHPSTRADGGTTGRCRCHERDHEVVGGLEYAKPPEPQGNAPRFRAI